MYFVPFQLTSVESAYKVAQTSLNSERKSFEVQMRKMERKLQVKWPRCLCPHMWFHTAIGFLHHNQFFDVLIKTSDYDIKNLIDPPGPLERLTLDVWTDCCLQLVQRSNY